MNTKNSIEFDIVMTAYKAGTYIEQTLDSVFNNFNDCTNANCNLYLGIDACHETLAKICDIYAKYDKRLHIFWSENNVGTYILKNSLTKQISNDKAFIYFFDSDDILPHGFLKQYLNFMTEKPELSAHCIIRTMVLSVPDKFLSVLGNEIGTSKFWQNNLSIFNSLLSSIQQMVNSMYYGILNSQEENILARKIMTYISTTSPEEQLSYKPYKYEAYGPVIIRFDTFKKLGGYNNARIEQDNDLLKRARSLKIKIEKNDSLMAFLRRIHASSLTGTQKTSFLSDTRMEIREVSDSKIRMKNYIADYVCVALNKVC